MTVPMRVNNDRSGVESAFDYCRNRDKFMMCFSFSMTRYFVQIRPGPGHMWQVPNDGFPGDPEPPDHPAGLAM
jgi:hypothetical protein